MTSAAPDPADPARLFAKAVYWQLVHELRNALPPPATSSPADVTRRDLAAIARVAGLRPANAEETSLAVNYVAASIQSLDCLRLAQEFPADASHVQRCIAQSASMMRQARGWLRALHSAQAARATRVADPAAHAAAEAAEYEALALLGEALDQAPPTPAPPAAEPAPANPIAEAERYALHHRKRAALIRRLQRLPEKIPIGPMRPEVLRAIITGNTPILRALDEKTARRLAAAA